MKLIIQIPCYNEEPSIPFFYKEIDKISKSMKNEFEFIFVNYKMIFSISFWQSILYSPLESVSSKFSFPIEILFR